MTEREGLEEVVVWPAADPKRLLHLATVDGARRGVTLCGLPTRPGLAQWDGDLSAPPVATRAAICEKCERQADAIPDVH